MPLQLVTAPTAEPLSLAQAKQHLRLTTADEDALVTGLIEAARRMAEARTRGQILAARWKYVIDSFPGPALYGVPFGKTLSLPEHAILLPKGPVLQVVSVTYTDLSGVTQTLVQGQSNDYVVSQPTEPGEVTRITPPFGKIWPIPMPQIGAVQVTFDAGYAAPIAAVDANADTIKVPGWKTLVVADALRLSNRDEAAVGDGSLPAATPSLAPLTDYYVQAVTAADTYKLAASAGGAVIDLTGAGGGKSFIGAIPASLRAWMLLAVGSLYENRESISVDSRITQIELPADFLDGLLDPHRIVLY